MYVCLYNRYCCCHSTKHFFFRLVFYWNFPFILFWYGKCATIFSTHSYNNKRRDVLFAVDFFFVENTFVIVRKFSVKFSFTIYVQYVYIYMVRVIRRAFYVWFSIFLKTFNNLTRKENKNNDEKKREKNPQVMIVFFCLLFPLYMYIS